MQRTLAVELQRLSVQFRKQQKAYLNRIRSKDGGGGAGGAGSSFDLLDEGGRGRGQEGGDYDPGFSSTQVGRLRRLYRTAFLAVTASAPSRDFGFAKGRLQTP